MALEIQNGLYCLSDIYLASALASRNCVMRDGVVDGTHVLDGLELAFSYVKVVSRRKRRPRGAQGKGYLEYQRETGEIHPDLREAVPVVMFAFKPHRGNHRLAEMKKNLWHNGALWCGPAFAVKHAELRREVRKVLDKWRETTGQPNAEVKFRSFAHEFHSDEMGGRATLRKMDVEEGDLPDVRVEPEK